MLIDSGYDGGYRQVVIAMVDGGGGDGQCWAAIAN